jgi:phospholipase/carboxylesterase
VDAGRLAGVPVLVAQGDADTVIPRELLDRTWSYLHDSSGAELTAHRDPGGHGLSAGTLDALTGWLTAKA